MLLGGKSVEQWLFSNKDRIALLEQWKKADKYGLTNQQFCQALINNGQGATKLIGKVGLAAPSQGKTFTDALNGWFPDLVIATIRVALDAGDLQVGLNAAIKQMQGGEQVIWRIVRKLAFPFALNVGVGILGVYVSGELLNASKTTVGIGSDIRTLVQNIGPALIIIFLALLLAIGLALPRWTGQGRKVMDKMPIFSLYRTATAASVLGTLGNLVGCGMKLGDALSAVETQSPPYTRYHLNKMKQQNIGQSNLGNILDTGLLIPFELGTLQVLGEDTDYVELLNESAESHEKSTQSRLNIMDMYLPKIGLLLALLLLGSLIASSFAQLYSTIQ